MRIPGFNAEASLGPSTRKYRSRYLPPETAGGVTPAYMAGTESLEDAELASEIDDGDDMEPMEGLGDDSLDDGYADESDIDIGPAASQSEDMGDLSGLEAGEAGELVMHDEGEEDGEADDLDEDEDEGDGNDEDDDEALGG